jgi:hypothetical protein
MGRWRGCCEGCSNPLGQQILLAGFVASFILAPSFKNGREPVDLHEQIGQRADRFIRQADFYTAGFAVYIGSSMTNRNDSSAPPSRFMVVGAWVCGIASVGGLVAMILIAIDKVSRGHGLDTYRTKWMVEDNWFGFLVFVVLTIFTVLAAAIIGWFQRRSDRREVQQIHAKYSKGHHG